MKRLFPPPALEALPVLVACALLCGAACTPSHDVKPGAPELIEFNIVQAGAPPTALVITPSTPECPSISTGASCLPMGQPADPAADAGMIPPDTNCRLASANNWCTCLTPDPMNAPAVGVWNCDPLPNVIAVVAVFDRLLDTAPLDPGDAAALTDVVTAKDGMNNPLDLGADYSSTGNANGLVFNIYGPFFGNFRADGPSLMAGPQPVPIFPSGATVTVALNADKIRAKDGKTPFIAHDLLMGMMVTFTMAPFTASIVPPDFKSMTDPITAFVALTNLSDVPGCGIVMEVGPCTIAGHITVTADGAPFAVTVTSQDGASFAVDPPKAAPWPMGATIVITLDAAVQNLLGQTIDMAHNLTFTAP